MGDISEHFSRWEFACHCAEDCGFAAVDVGLLKILEAVRNHYNIPVIINSGCRCLNFNRSIGSEDNSQHVRGLAADITIKNIDPEDTAFWAEQNYLTGWGGIGIYKNVTSHVTGNVINFVHIDVRKTMARWRRENELI